MKHSSPEDPCTISLNYFCLQDGGLLVLVHNREIISFGLWRILITPSKLVFSSSVRTFNQYSSPDIRQDIQKTEYAQAAQGFVSQGTYFFLHLIKNNGRGMETSTQGGCCASVQCKAWHEECCFGSCDTPGRFQRTTERRKRQSDPCPRQTLGNAASLISVPIRR